MCFRFTCYYYRGAYYKAFWADPPSCAVGEPRKSYLGENSFPLILQNIHRYSMYAAVVFLFLLSYDVWLAMWFDNPATGVKEFGIGVGTIVLLVNVVLLTSYTLGCHSMRHLVGGVKDEISKSPVSQACYNCSTSFNTRHQLFAWVQLVLGDVRRHLHPPLLDGDLDRSEAPLMAAHADLFIRRPGHRAPAAPGCARRSKPPTPASPSG